MSVCVCGGGGGGSGERVRVGTHVLFGCDCCVPKTAIASVFLCYGVGGRERARERETMMRAFLRFFVHLLLSKLKLRFTFIALFVDFRIVFDFLYIIYVGLMAICWERAYIVSFHLKLRHNQFENDLKV